MTAPHSSRQCPLCSTSYTLEEKDREPFCPSCVSLIEKGIKKNPEAVQKIWKNCCSETVHTQFPHVLDQNGELPEVLDGKRYRVVDREYNKWYLSVTEISGRPVEIFASTAFDRDHELQSRISNLTTITRLTSLILKHIFTGKSITLEKCLKQLQRSSRQKDDLPDMLYGVLSKYR